MDAAVIDFVEQEQIEPSARLLIPLEDQAKIFDRFLRSSSATHLAVPGTGLGLSITKMIIDGHGCRITVSSKPGEGTTITITLPLEATGQPSVEESPPIAPVRS